jgi:non-ribosomal peptide synthetase component E (peptide arylation enzyme)
MVEDVTAVIIPEKLDIKTTQAQVDAFRQSLLNYSTKLAHFKHPKFIRLVEEFPITANGKVRKNVLRDTSNDLLEN